MLKEELIEHLNKQEVGELVVRPSQERNVSSGESNVSSGEINLCKGPKIRCVWFVGAKRNIESGE